MKPQKQAFYHHPEAGVYGDCYRTVIASLLDLDRDEVPHVHDGASMKDQSETASLIGQFLLARGLREISFAYSGEMSLMDVLTAASNCNPGLHWMLTGKSGSDVNHVVICRDREIVWDTSRNDSGIVGVCDDGNWWVSFLGAAI